MLRNLSLLILLCLAFGFSKAAHIVGGDMYYECLGNNSYRITLKIYRDCNAFGPNVAGFDSPAYIAIYNGGDKSLIEVIDAFLTSGPNNIPALTSDPCLQAPANVCVEEGIYRFTRTLPPLSGGYDIVYIRCCRNSTIQNIFTPGDVGATYFTHIPGSGIATCNSSPYFKDFPPIVICANAPINFDHSAIDPDGDQLVYSLCTPYPGATNANPQPYPGFTLQPFGNIPWRNPYSGSFPLDAAPPLSIDPQTGILSGTPNRTGQFVVGVCVSEYRSGVLIGETKRDFQFNVVQCNTNVSARIPVVDTTGAAASGTAGVFAYQCQGLFVQFINQSINGTFYHWDFGDLTTLADTSRAFQPSYTYPDSGSYIVRLIVNPGYPCADTTRVIVRIYPNFDADFDFYAGCVNQPVIFTDQSSTTYGMVDSWYWTFGDGQFSSNQNPEHLYAQGGTFSVTLNATNTKGCRDSQSKTVTVRPMPIADFSFTPTCINTPVTFTDLSLVSSGTISTRTWLMNNNQIGANSPFTQTFNNLMTFDLTLIVESNFGCADTITQTITVHPNPVVVIRPDTAICAGESVQLFAAGGVSYQWQPPTNLSSTTISNPVATPASSTVYSVVVTDINSCTDNAAVSITVNPLPATNAGADTYICFGDTFQLNGTGGNSFFWTPGNLLSDSTISNPFTSPDSTVTFVLTSFNQFGCSNRDSFTLTVQRPIVIALSENQDMCEGDTITLSASGGLYYLWQPNTGISGNSNADFTISPATDIIYTIIVSNDCFADTGYVEVIVHGLPEVDAGIDDSIRRDEFVFLNGFSTGVQNFWEPPDGLDNPTSLTTRASPFNTTNYVLNAVSEYGCIARDTVNIKVEVVNLLIVPNAFSPNGDGVNDIFRIIRYLNVERLLEFRIFNRWGQLVFETTDIRDGWDGTYKGDPQGLGVFVYVIRVLNRDGEIIVRQGDLTLVK